VETRAIRATQTTLSRPDARLGLLQEGNSTDPFRVRVHLSSGVSRRKNHRLSGLNNGNLFSSNSGGSKFKIKA
jgi:hypothetical protein